MATKGLPRTEGKLVLPDLWPLFIHPGGTPESLGFLVSIRLMPQDRHTAMEFESLGLGRRLVDLQGHGQEALLGASGKMPPSQLLNQEFPVTMTGLGGLQARVPSRQSRDWLCVQHTLGTQETVYR